MKRMGFSMIELVFVIVILGVLTAVALPRLSVGRDDACFAKLKANLSEVETILSREYTKNFLQNKKMDTADLDKYLKVLQNDNSDRCKFSNISSSSITANIGSKTISLSVTNDATTKMPTITCTQDTEDCKKLTGKAIK